MSVLVYVPVSHDLARRLRQGSAKGPWHAFSVTTGLRDWVAEAAADAGLEEYEYAALHAAGARSRSQPQLVLAADVGEAVLTDPDLVEPGTVTVAELSWAQVTALFVPEPTPDGAEQPDLLWFAPEELDAIA